MNSCIKPHMLESLGDSHLEKIEDTSAHVMLFKLTPPKHFHWCYIMMTPVGIFIGGDQKFGDTTHGMAIAPGYGLDLMLKGDEEEYLGSKFFGRKPTGKVALEKWSNDVGWLMAVRNEFVRLYVKKQEEASR